MSPALILLGRAVLILGGVLTAAFAFAIMGGSAKDYAEHAQYGAALAHAGVTVMYLLLAAAMIILGITQ